jgi:hypothetical protein
MFIMTTLQRLQDLTICLWLEEIGCLLVANEELHVLKTEWGSIGSVSRILPWVKQEKEGKNNHVGCCQIDSIVPGTSAVGDVSEDLDWHRFDAVLEAGLPS